MRTDLPILMEFFVAFAHPLIMIIALAGMIYAAYLGMQVRRTRNAQGEDRKEMVKARYNQKHFQLASILLSVWLLGSFLGMAATDYLYGKLFVSPHLIGGLGAICLAALAGSLVPFLQRGKTWARTTHIVLAVGLVILSLSQAVTGINIVRIMLSEIMPTIF